MTTPDSHIGRRARRDRVGAGVERAIEHVRPGVFVGRLPLGPERVLRLARGDG